MTRRTTITGFAANCPHCGARLTQFVSDTGDGGRADWRTARLFTGRCSGCRRDIEYEVLPPCTEFRIRLHAIVERRRWFGLRYIEGA